MIIFERCEIQNFLSVGNTPIVIEYDKHSTTSVVGTNGEGKSGTLLDAPFFACFGKPFRNINIPNVINSINNGNCVVTLHLRSGTRKYKIVRGLKPKIFEIYENDVLVDQDAHAKDYQEYLETYVLGGMNERIFRQIVIMGSANFVPFMQLTAAGRREVIEELLDIKVFSNMANLAKERLAVIKENLKDMDSGITLVQERISIHEENQTKIDGDMNSKKKSIEDQIRAENFEIEDIQLEIKKLISQKDSLSSKVTKYDELVSSRKDINKSLIEISTKQELAKDIVSFFSHNEVCPTCSQDIESEHKQKVICENEVSIGSFEDSIKDLEDKLNKHDVIIDTLNKVNININRLDDKIYEKQSDITSKQKFINQLQKELNSLLKTNKSINTDVSDLKASLDKLKDKRINMLEERQYYEVISGMLKDDGIKTKIIQQYIPVFNKIINEYLIRFGLPIEFTLDDKFNEIIKSRYRDKYQYNNFSEGEKQRIDLALLLAWRQVAKSKNTLNVNLLIFDEIFDKSLDSNATEELINILLEQDKSQNIFVISHKLNLEDKLEHVMRFKKIGNFTHLV